MAVKVMKKRGKVKRVRAVPVTQTEPVSPEVKRVFARSLKQWKAEERPSSFMMDRITHPAYMRIVGLGPAAIPLILRALEKEPDPWFAALEAITGEKQVIKSEHYRFTKMVEAWLQWGRKRGYLS